MKLLKLFTVLYMTVLGTSGVVLLLAEMTNWDTLQFIIVKGLGALCLFVTITMYNLQFKSKSIM